MDPKRVQNLKPIDKEIPNVTNYPDLIKSDNGPNKTEQAMELKVRKKTVKRDRIVRRTNQVEREKTEDRQERVR